MRFSFFKFLLSCVGIALAAAPAIPNQSPSLIWAGKSDGKTIRWTTSDVEVLANDGKQVFSSRALALEEYKSFGRTASEPPCQFTRKFAILSVVGPFLTYRYDDERFCEDWAHSDDTIRVVTLNLKSSGQSTGGSAPPKTGMETTLNQIFPADELRDALYADRLVRQALDASDVGTKPANLDDTVQAIASSLTGSDKCTFQLGTEFLSGFSLHHYEGDKVAVRVFLVEGLDTICSAEGYVTQLGLLLHVPSAEWKEWLQKADRREEGFLMKDASKVGQGRTAIIHFATGKATHK